MTGRLCGPKAEQERPTDHQSLLPKKEIATLLPVAEKVSESVSVYYMDGNVCVFIFTMFCYEYLLNTSSQDER